MKSNFNVNFISRKRLANANSIEELFKTIRLNLDKDIKTSVTELSHYGASPSVLLKNLLNFRTKADINHITGDVHYMVLAARKNAVLTIHDVRSANQGSFLKRCYILLFWFWLPSFFVKRITVISEFTKLELSKIIPFAKNKICVVHNPVNPLLEPFPYSFNTDKPQILFIGTKSNKNLERSLMAIKDLNCKVIIIGPLGKNQIQILNHCNIDFVNKYNLSFEQIKRCYQEADLICFASTYEGFGMPIIEAQTVGRPVVTSNFGAMLEVAGASACLVNPYNENDIREGILKICSDANYRDSLIEMGKENVKRFKLDQVTKDYLKVYSEILKTR